MHFIQCGICTEYKHRSLNLCFLTSTQKSNVETIINKLFSLSICIHNNANICAECDGILTEFLKFYEKIQNGLQKLSQKTFEVIDPLNIKSESSSLQPLNHTDFKKTLTDKENSIDSEKIFTNYNLSEESCSVDTVYSTEENERRNSRNISYKNVSHDSEYKTEAVKIDTVLPEERTTPNCDTAATTEIQINVVGKINETNDTEHPQSDSLMLLKDNIVVCNTDVEKCNRLNNVVFPKEIIKDGKFILKPEAIDDLIDKFYNFYCDLCTDSIRFANLLHLFIHYHQQHKKKGYVKCCDKKLGNRRCIKMHMARHIQPSAFECSICHKSFSLLSILRNHQITHLPDSKKPHKCDQCDRRFSYKYLLQKHTLHHVPDDKKYEYKCDQCGKGYASIIRLQTHCASVHVENKYMCAICGKLFKIKGLYKAHVGTHIDKDIRNKTPCPECGTRVPNKYALKLHMAVHGPKKFSCSQCEHKTYSKPRLNAHIKRIHSENRPFKCLFCPRTFKFMKGLEDHKSQHTGEQKYPCSFCPKRFRNTGNLYSHMIRMHPEYKRNKKRVAAVEFKNKTAKITP